MNLLCVFKTEFFFKLSSNEVVILSSREIICVSSLKAKHSKLLTTLFDVNSQCIGCLTLGDFQR